MKKEFIKKAFSKAATTYDTYADVQKEVAEEVAALLLSDLPPTPSTMTVLDIGCGTGALMEYIKGNRPEASVYGTDIALPMLVRARERLNGRDKGFITADFESLPFPDSTFDAVVSSFTFQWAVDTEAAFREVFRVLRPGGTFVFSTLGPGTMRELRESTTEAQETLGKNGLPEFIAFMDTEKITSALELSGFKEVKVERECKEREYADLRELLITLKKIGAVNPNPGGGSLGRGAILREAGGIYARKFPAKEGQGIHATYDVVFCMARKV